MNKKFKRVKKCKFGVMPGYDLGKLFSLKPLFEMADDGYTNTTNNKPVFVNEFIRPTDIKTPDDVLKWQLLIERGKHFSLKNATIKMYRSTVKFYGNELLNSIGLGNNTITKDQMSGALVDFIYSNLKRVSEQRHSMDEGIHRPSESYSNASDEYHVMQLIKRLIDSKTKVRHTGSAAEKIRGVQQKIEASELKRRARESTRVPVQRAYVPPRTDISRSTKDLIGGVGIVGFWDQGFCKKCGVKGIVAEGADGRKTFVCTNPNCPEHMKIYTIRPAPVTRRRM